MTPETETLSAIFQVIVYVIIPLIIVAIVWRRK